MKTQSAGRAANPTRWVLLGATAVLAGLAVYYSRRSPVPSRPRMPGAAETTLGQRVVSNARSLIASQRYKEAIDLARAHMKLHPRDLEVWLVLAEAQSKAGELQSADETLDTLLAAAPEFPLALWLKGQIVRRLGGGDYMDYFRKAIESPEGASAELLADYGLELLAIEKIEEAEEYFNRAVQQGATGAAAMEGLGRIAMLRGRYDQAEQMLSGAAAREPQSLDLRVLLGRAQLEAGKIDQADKTVEQTAGLRGDKKALWLLLGEIRLKQNRKAEAAEAFMIAAGHPSNRKQAAFLAAGCHLDLGQYDMAKKYIDMAGQAGMEGREYEKLLKRIKEALAAGH